jgi:hypothetical protein
VLGSVLLLAPFLPRPIRGQEIGVFAGKGWSDQREAGDPTSLGIRAQYLVTDSFCPYDEDFGLHELTLHGSLRF